MRLDGPSPQKVLLRGMPFAGHAGALPRCCVARLRGLYCGAGDRPLSIKTASSPYGASASSYQSNSKVTSRLRQGCPARCPPRPRPRVFGAIRACAKGPIRFEIQMGRPAAHAPKGLGRFGLVRFETQPFPTHMHPRGARLKIEPCNPLPEPPRTRPRTSYFRKLQLWARVREH